MEQRSLDLLLARKVQLLVYLERRVGSRADAEDLFRPPCFDCWTSASQSDSETSWCRGSIGFSTI